MSKGAPAAASAMGAPPASKAAPKVAASPPRGAGGISFAEILQDLDKAENMVFGSAFAAFGFDQVPMSNQAIREFIATNSSLGMDDVDVATLRHAPADGDMHLTLDSFVKILREHAVVDGKVLERFMSLSSNQETIDSQECRSGLLMFKEDLGPDSVRDDRWEQVFDVVMHDAGAVVSMENWCNYCKKVARTARVVHLSKA